MISSPSKTIQTAAVMIILAGLTTMCYLGRDIIFPVFMALLISILLMPFASFLANRMRFPNVLASLIVVILAVLVLGSVIFFLSNQVAQFSDDFPRIKQNVSWHFHHFQQWVYKTFNISYSTQADYIENTMDKGKELGGTTIHTFTGMLIDMVLIPIYTFLILLYRTLLINFLIKLVSEEHHTNMRDILFEIKTVVRGYIIGLATELIVVAVLTSLGLWIIGADYFIFLGLLTAVLNLIPYIGIILATAVCMFVSMATSHELHPVLGAVVVNAVVHFLDANVLSPRIVGSKVSINALACILGVVIGGALTGITGMFVAIPFLAILKVIFDRVEGLKPWGYLLGDTMPKTITRWGIRIPDYNATQPEEETVKKNEASEEQKESPPRD